MDFSLSPRVPLGMDLQFVMTNPGTETNQFMSNLHLTPSEPHPTVGNPEDDQSMSDLNWVLSMLNDSGDGGVKDADDLPSPSKIPVEGIPSPGLAAEVGGDRFLPSAGAPHVAVGNELPPGHGSHVQMEGDQSLAHARCCTDISTDRVGAVPETGSLEGDGSRGPLPDRITCISNLPKASSSRTQARTRSEIRVLPPLAPQRRSQRPNSP